MRGELIRQLKSLKHASVKPQSGWVKKNRAILLSQIKNTVPEKVSTPITTRFGYAMSIFMPQSIALNVVRPMAVLLIVALIAPTLYYGTVFASEGALPGEGLYEAKRYTEKIQVTVVGIIGDKKQETKLHATLAKRRAEETSKIISATDPKKKAAVATTVADLKNEINALNNKLEESKKDSAVSADVAKEVKKNTEEINVVLQDVKNSLVVGTDNNKALEEIKETKNLVQEVAVKAVEVVVSKHLEGDKTVSNEEVKELITNSLQKSVDSVAESKQNIEGFKNILVTTSDEVKDLSKEIGNAEAASSTKVISQQISTVINQTEAAMASTTAASQQATVKADEAKQLLGSDKLAEAVSAIKELSAVSKEAEKLSDTAIQSTKSVLPIVQVIREAAAIVSGAASSTTSTISSTSTQGMSTSTLDAINTLTTTIKMLISSTTPTSGSTTAATTSKTN